MTHIAHATDTIFARASGAGRAGVAVFRVSGPDARRISALLSKRNITPRRPALAAIHDPESGEEIDRGLVILFEGPASFTGEDVAEFHLHGSRAVETAFAEAAAKAGARPAEAGEFARRALINGKLDLAQVEALADLIDAETSQQRKQALGQFEGRLSSLAEDWRGRLIAVLAPLEADIDFPDEEDIPAAIAARAGPAIEALIAELKSCLEGAGRARRLREGVTAAILGAPNSGKSSLLNALAGADVAIVSSVAGTTRDVIETRLDLGGVPVLFADTAGLRDQSTDEIEMEGMRRALLRAETADLRIMVIDPFTEGNGFPSHEKGGLGAPALRTQSRSRPKGRDQTAAAAKAAGDPPLAPPFQGGESHRACAGSGESRQRRSVPPLEKGGPGGDQAPGSAGPGGLLRPGDVVVFSKKDLGGRPGPVPEGLYAFHVSAKSGEGMAELMAGLLARAADLAGGSEAAALTRIRHVEAVTRAVSALERALARVSSDPELAAEDARLAARALGQITGAVDVEDVLDAIFSSFCIGK